MKHVIFMHSEHVYTYSKLFTVRYSDVTQTIVITEEQPLPQIVNEGSSNMCTVLFTALSVATIGSSGWTYLTKEGDGVWKGTVDTGEGGHELKLGAQIDKTSNIHEYLLTYNVRVSVRRITFSGQSIN